MTVKKLVVVIGILIGIIAILLGVIVTALPTTSKQHLVQSYFGGTGSAYKASKSTNKTLHIKTIVKIWTPLTLSGKPAPGLKISKVVSGSCWEGSLSINDPNAWRCTSQNTIYDPCWVNETGTIAYYAPYPWSHTAIKIQLTKPLPYSLSNTGKPMTGWALQLANGQNCVVSTGGGLPIYFGVHLDYSCTQGWAGQLRHKGSTMYVQYYGGKQGGTASLKTEPVLVAWKD